MIEVGPNMLIFLLALPVLVASVASAIQSSRLHGKIDRANGNLAIALSKQAAVDEAVKAIADKQTSQNKGD